MGSTAVPGLAAKPVIDIDVAVAVESDVPGAVRLLATLGYEHRGDRGIKGREAFWTPADAYPHHLYLVTAESRPFKRHMAFRDRMRADANAAREYATLKRVLAARFGADRLNYTEAKTEFIERILAEEPGPPH
ncbi:MAG: GrpB family protein [Chloroflexi bacterium]|nr:GrpB family protein [Chloroflexota bacterium]MDA1297112.1 GrpB family protein [Chloroflexota bacterium]